MGTTVTATVTATVQLFRVFPDLEKLIFEKSVAWQSTGIFAGVSSMLTLKCDLFLQNVGAERINRSETAGLWMSIE